MLNRNDKKEIAGKLKALFPKASDSGREQLLNLLVNCCCIDLCSINNNADNIQFTGLTLLGNNLVLTLTINGVPTTQTVTLPTQVSTTLVNNGDGTFTYTNESNVVTTIDVATLLVDAGISDGFVNNNDGTLTHAAIDGTVVTFDINDLLLTTTPLFTVNAGTTSVSTDASLGSQVITYGDILHFWSNGSLNFNVQAGSVVVGIDTEADIIPYTPTTLVSTNVGDALDELAANSHNPTTLTNTAAPFSWNVSTQAGNIPVSPTLVNNGNGTITFTSGTGTAPVIIDVTENASEVLTTTPITINGTTYPANTTVETILSAISTYAGTTNLTYTPSATNGTIVSDTGTDATIPSATTSLAGLLTSTDKTKLDGIAIGANNYVHPNHSGDVTSVADGVTTIAPNAVTNAKLAQAPANTLKGNNTGAVANVTDLSVTDVKTLLTYTGADVANTPAGNIAATTVQAAINELDGEKQVNLQFQEEGVNLGTSGTVDTVNFTGAAVTSSRVGNTLTVDIPASAGVTNLSYTPSATNGIVVSDTGTDATITSVTGVNAGLATPTMFTNSHVPVTTVAGSVTIGLSGTDNQTLKADITGISGATTGQVPSKDALGNITWITPAGGGTITSTDSNTVDFTVTGSDITGSVKLDNANGGLTATTNGLLFNADGVNTYDNTTSGITATTVQDAIDEVAGSFWHLKGNAGTDGGTTNFVGTTDAQDFVVKTNSIEIARFGQQGNAALGSDLTSIDPSFIPPVANNIGSMAFQSGQATGALSTAFQLGVASGDASMAWGIPFAGIVPNIASGINSTAFGEGNLASGILSTAFGRGNTAPSVSETTLGFYSTNYTVANNNSDRLFTIGNGTSNTIRNNALTLWKDGRSMWNGDVAKQNTWIGVNGTNPQNFINITTPTGALAAVSTEHTTSGNYAVLGSNAGNSGLVINDTKKFFFTTTTGTTSTQLGATSTIANYSNTGFLFGGGGVATSTVDVSGTLGLSNVRINTANPVLNLNNTVYHFTGGASGTVDMTLMEIDNRTFILTNYSGVSLTLSHSVRTGSATTTTTLLNNISMTIAYDGVEFFRVA